MLSLLRRPFFRRFLGIILLFPLYLEKLEEFRILAISPFLVLAFPCSDLVQRFRLDVLPDFFPVTVELQTTVTELLIFFFRPVRLRSLSWRFHTNISDSFRKLFGIAPSNLTHFVSDLFAGARRYLLPQ